MTISESMRSGSVFSVEIAELQMKNAKLRAKLAQIELAHYDMMLRIREWEERTGLHHYYLLDGDFENPLGQVVK